MKEPNAIEVRDLLNHLLTYYKLNKLTADLKANYSVTSDFSWVTEKEEILRKKISLSINQLSDTQTRQIMKLRYIDGKTVKEIASLLGISYHTCYVYISKAYQEITLIE